MRISDWSSDVCSSDLIVRVEERQELRMAFAADPAELEVEHIGPCRVERSEHAFEQRMDHAVFGRGEIRQAVDGRFTLDAIIGVHQRADQVRLPGRKSTRLHYST